MDPNLASWKGITERNDLNNSKEYDHPFKHTRCKVWGSIREVPWELGRNADEVFELWVWFLKMRIKFPRSLPAVNQSSVLHQKSLLLLGLRLDLAGQLPWKLWWKQSKFFSRSPPDFGPIFRARLQQTVRSWVFQKCLPIIRLPLFEYFCIGPEFGIDLFGCYWWTTAAKFVAISFLGATFLSASVILSPIFLAREFMVMGVAPFESPPSPLSDDIFTLLYFCLKVIILSNP